MKTTHLINLLCRLNEFKEKELAYAETFNQQPSLKRLYVESVLEEERRCKQQLNTMMRWEN